MAPIPHGAAARALPPCDLVMKGGITSGIVYPPVVKVLAERYRFDSIGGTSAGAIAAAVTAAGEYGRQRDNGGGIERLDAAVRDLTTPGLLAGLFQPTPQTRPLFDILLRALPKSDPGVPGEDTASPPSNARPLRKSARLAADAVVIATRARSETRLAGVVLVSVLAALVVAAFDAFPAGAAAALTVAAVILAAIVVVTVAVVALGLLVWQTYRALDTSDFGMCPGTKQGDGPEVALIDWLHKQIQCCAGRATADPPLTFGELREQGITLTMMSTDLSFGRPVRLPDGLTDYLFDPAEMRRRFPESVVDAMMTAAGAEDVTAAWYQSMPIDDLPVLVGVRLSLSFPVLLSAMPLYLHNADAARVERHVFSDGGISSNFPVHFFDAWFPGRPTFGIDLARHPEGQPDSAFMPTDPTAPLPPRLSEVRSVRTFAANIIDTMQNWRDSLQSELPGFRDRICQIRMSQREGGLSLTMPPAVVEQLLELGELGGHTILWTFDQRRWDAHRWIRYLTMMSQLEGNLQKAGAPFATFRLDLANGLPDVPFSVYRLGRGFEWCQSAEQATTDLLTLAGAWGPAPLGIDFCGEALPIPVPVMRIVPVA
jgi:predicted acylesterase/phospholipase RssA